MLRAGPRPEPPKPIPDRMRLRVERQTLRRLPRSGAIVFTIRVYMTPLAGLGPGEAGRLAAALRGVKEQEDVYMYVWEFLPFLV
jgi:heme-dependent oxidative N-demethylase alpha subunit-like protein